MRQRAFVPARGAGFNAWLDEMRWAAVLLFQVLVVTSPPPQYIFTEVVSNVMMQLHGVLSAKGSSDASLAAAPFESSWSVSLMDGESCMPSARCSGSASSACLAMTSQ